MDYHKLKRALPRGACSKIAKKLNIDKSTVAKVSRGEVENLEILTELVKYAEYIKNKKNDLQTKINNL